MAGPERRESTGLDRSRSRRESTWSSTHMTDEDSDYDLDASGMSDGFRPMTTMDANSPRSPSQAYHSIPARKSVPPPRPSSATKPKNFESFALRHDGGMGDVGRRSTAGPSSDSGRSRRSSTSTDSAAFVRFDEPYQGPSGPSFAYQTYPQESRAARTLSVATASTARATERSYAGPTGPTHPYGMYPQNIVPEAGSVIEDSNRPPPIPVGFTGLNTDYRRRLGPDGEEVADIIGPDGHTEQLPPYTQYPDEAFARKDRAARASVAGAGGIGLATRNPEFSSQEDISSPEPPRSAHHSTRSESPEPPGQSNDADVEYSEKTRAKKWQQVARRKVCGIIPIWALALAATVLVLVGIILGATMAAMSTKDRDVTLNGDYQSIIYTTAVLTSTFDASPFTGSPTGLPTLPTGTFALPVTAPSAVQNSCFSKTEQSKAWSCAMPDSPLQIEVFALSNPDPFASSEMVLDYGNETVDFFAYGTQPPILEDPQQLNLVYDTQEPHRGPAWFFQASYNKLTIVESDLLASPYDQKRDLESGDEPRHHDPIGGLSKKGIAQDGDTPWFCYWNDTLIEAFLYVNLTSSEAVHSAQHSLSRTASSSFPTGTSVFASSVDFSESSTETIYTGPSWPAHDLLTAYPKVLKLQERRIPKGPGYIAPYCIKKRVSSSGSATTVLNSTGQPVMLWLDETEPDSISPILKRARSIRLWGTRNDEVAEAKEKRTTGSCGCVWLAT